MQRGNTERGGFLRGDQSVGPRIGQPMAQMPGSHMHHGPPGPPRHLMAQMQPRPPPGRPPSGGKFHSRQQEQGPHRPAPAGPHHPFPHAGMPPHPRGQAMQPQLPQPPMRPDRGTRSIADADAGGDVRGVKRPHNSEPNMDGSSEPDGPEPQAEAAPAAASVIPRLRATDNDFEDLVNVVVAPEDVLAVGYLERLRAMNALAKVGAAARAEHSASAIKAAAAAFRSGAALKGSAYSEDVSIYVPLSVDAALGAR